MATGIIGNLTNGTLTYTAPIDAKFIITSYGASSGVTINGASSFVGGSSLSHFVGAGQTIVVSVPNATYCMMSVLEGS